MDRDILLRISRGEFSETELAAIVRAANSRISYLQDQRGAQNQAEFTPGTKVKIAGDIKPKYLLGLTGTVSADATKRSGDITFEFDDRSYPYVSHRFRRTVGIPASCLARV